MRGRLAVPTPVEAKPVLMDALPWPVWKRVAYPLWLRWYEHWMASSAWRSRGYNVGDVAVWRGVRLVCCTSHYAGDSAEHPWDPGMGWHSLKANALWEPRSERDRRVLRVVGDPRRSA